MAVDIEPVDNQAPVVTVGEQFYVNEGNRTRIELRHLTAADVDTADDDIICVIVTQPNEGYLENVSPAEGSEKSRVGVAISSFTIGDIKAGDINYMQGSNAKSEPDVDRLSFICQDGAPNSSPSEFFDIGINPGKSQPIIVCRYLPVCFNPSRPTRVIRVA